MLPFAAAAFAVALFTLDATAQVKLRQPVPLSESIEEDQISTAGFPPLRVKFTNDCAASPAGAGSSLTLRALISPLECEPCCRSSFCDCLASGRAHICQDARNFYSCSKIMCDVTVLSVAATLAHTDADQSIRDWYQRDVRNARTDEWAKFGKNFGELWTLGIYGGALVLGKATEDTCCGAVTYDWANRSVRSLIIGAPVIGVLQRGLGSSRPWEERGSQWRPMEDDSGASGHAFLGAVPFLTAASMTENRLLRGSLIVASTWTAWSRINDDEHYLSQVILGWYVAYQAVQSVNCTQCQERRWRILPYRHPEGTGLAVHLRY